MTHKLHPSLVTLLLSSHSSLPVTIPLGHVRVHTSADVGEPPEH